jgi:type IV pilus assembly protein PilM
LPTLTSQPGCFFVACGLALQGLGLAAVDTNLMPEEEGGLLQRMTQLMTRRIGGAKTAWGLDLSSSGLKALKLAAGGSEAANPSIDDAAWLEHRKPLHQAGSPVEERTLIAETLTRFLETHKLAGDRVCLGLSSAAVMLRDARIPSASARKQEAVIEHQVKMLFPIPESELLWDYTVVDETASDDDRPREIEIKLLAVRKHPLVERMAVLEEHGINVDLWQSDCVALHNFLQYDGGVDVRAARSEAAAPRGLTVALDIGCDTTSVVFSGPKSLWFRTSSVGAHRINRVVIQRFGLTFAQSEQWKRQPHLAPSPRALYAHGFEPVFEDYLHEIQEAMHTFRAQHPDRSIERVVGVGGGWRAHGLLQYIIEQTSAE